MSIDHFLNRKYHYQKYHCLHFSRDVWLFLTGDDITEKLGNLLGKFSDKKVTSNVISSFKRLLKPETPCLVLMQRPRTSPHIGVYIDGNVLHIKTNGVEFFPLDIATIGFKKIKFYK